MDGRNVSAMQLCNIAQMHHAGEMALGNGDGSLLNFTGPHRANTLSGGGQREHADAIEQAAQRDFRHISGGPVP